MDVGKKEDIEAISKLIEEGFSEDPKMKYSLKNLNRRQFILKTISKSQVKEFLEKAEVYTIDNCKGAILGYNSRNIDFNEFINMFNDCNNELIKELSEQEIQILITNGEQLAKVENLMWLNETSEDYYHLVTIVVDKKFRGKGVFRKLISPLLKECDKEELPILLETHNKANVEIYRHFGFETVKEFTDEKLDFRQYCMVRKPNAKNIS